VLLAAADQARERGARLRHRHEVDQALVVVIVAAVAILVIFFITSSPPPCCMLFSVWEMTLLKCHKTSLF